MLRLVGDVEKFSCVKHFHGYYRSAAVTAGYATKVDTRDLTVLIENAVTKVVLQHPMLCVGIVGEDTERPALVRLNSIDLTQCIEYRDIIAFTPGEYNAALENILNRQHCRLWLDSYIRPAWRIIVAQCKTLPPVPTTFDIVFAYHHALADGISGLIFHRSFLQALNAPNSLENVQRNITIPEAITLPPPIEKQIQFTVSWPFFIREFWKARKPVWMKCPGKVPPWTSAPCSFRPIQNYRSRTKILSIGAYQLALILALCRRQKASLTGLLHGIIVSSLTFHVPQARSFNSGAPYSLRKLLDKTFEDVIGSYAWGYSIPYSANTISKIRSSMTDAEVINQVWEMARAFSDSLSTELSRLPKDNYIGLLSHATNLHKEFKSCVGKPRHETFEVSNLGVFKENGTESTIWRIDKMLFSQSGHALGSAVSFNVVSVSGGPLNICATWLEGAIEETLINLVCGDIVHNLDGLSRDVGTYGRMQNPGIVSVRE